MIPYVGKIRRDIIEYACINEIYQRSNINVDI